MKLGKEYFFQGAIIMTNTHCCAAGCGVEFCGFETTDDSLKYALIGLGILALLIIGIAIATNPALMVSPMVDGAVFMGY